MSFRPVPTDTFSLRKIQATPFPNRLLEIVATLSETEARIICVVVRATLGWRANKPGERRASVIMSQSELRGAIGRASKTAVSKAVDSLVRNGLVEVLGDQERVLSTPDDRRRYHRPLRYRVARRYVETVECEEGDNSVDKEKW